MSTREKIGRIVEHRHFQRGVLFLIILNAVILGIEATPEIHASLGLNLMMLDRVVLCLFVLELALRIFAGGFSFFRDPWNSFDFLVIGASLIALNGVSALRVLRVLRVLMVISAIPKLRVVVTALLESIPGIASVGFLVLLILYVAAIMATFMFGAAFPDYFGTLFRSMYTLFQILTLEGWVEIANTVLVEYPWSWVYFVTFILVATFTLLNLFVAIVVSVLEREDSPASDQILQESRLLREEIKGLHAKIDDLEKRLH